MNFLIVLVPFLIAIFLGWVILPYIMLITYKKRLFDAVDARKIHQRNIPRLGGVAFFPIQCFLFVLTVVIVYKVNFVDLGIQTWEVFPMFAVLLCGLFMLYMVGIGDDLVGVSPRWKFVIQLLAAAMFPLSGLWINDLYGVGLMVALPFWIGAPLTVFIVVLIINAINLIDGLNGLCSGLILVGCIVLGGLFAAYGAWLHALFAFLTAGVLIPFFYINVFGKSKRKHRIFMGDTGSLTLGYSIAFLAISFAMNNPVIKPFSEGAIVAAFSTLIVPVFDVARVMYIRWSSKKPLFMPDRNHLHHKFLRTGMSQTAAMIAILALALFFCLFNILLVQHISNNLVIIFDAALWGSFHLIFNKLEKKKFAALIAFANLF